MTDYLSVELNIDDVGLQKLFLLNLVRDFRHLHLMHCAQSFARPEKIMCGTHCWSNVT